MARSVGTTSKALFSSKHYATILLCISASVFILRCTDLEATYPIYIKRLKSLQNRAIRAVARSHYRDEVNPYYIQFKILEIENLLKYEIAKFVHCYTTNKTFNSFCNLSRKTVEHSSGVTREFSETRIFIFHATEQTNCKGALNIRDSTSGIPFLNKLGCYIIKNWKFSIKILC